MKIQQYLSMALVATSAISFAPHATAQTSGVSPYLPLKLDSMIELEIERLASITNMPKLTKPYHIASVVTYLNKVKHSHPSLYNRINSYVDRYKAKSAVTHYSVELAYGEKNGGTLGNQRGQSFDSMGKLSARGFYQANEYLIFNAGGSVVDGQGIVPQSSFVSFGVDYMQFDLGYREHWLSPMQESASLLSTNAPTAPSITVSNVNPLTDFNIHYEMSLSLLEEMQGIHFDDKISDGRPGLLTMHFSAQPIDGWTLGLNRSFQFAGGERSITLSDIWQAIIDPVNSDNCGGTDLVDCDKEVGNQIASITNRFDFSVFDKPVSFYFEYAGEDTKDHKNYQLGNLAYTYGLFLPYLSDSSSLYFEYSDYHSHWYIHHLYDEGYSNDGTIMGHWWANDRVQGDKVGGQTFNLRYNIDIQDFGHLTAKARFIKLNESTEADYQAAREFELSYKQTYKKGFVGVSLINKKNVYGDSFNRLSVSYNW